MALLLLAAVLGALPPALSAAKSEPVWAMAIATITPSPGSAGESCGMIAGRSMLAAIARRSAVSVSGSRWLFTYTFTWMCVARPLYQPG